MRKENHITGLALIALMGGVSISSAGYKTWRSEYDGTETSTLYLWNFNAGEYSGTVPYGKADNLSPSGPAPKAILYNNATYGVAGKFGEGASLTGTTGDKLHVGTLAAFPADTSLTVETWVRFDSFGTYQVLADKMRNDNAGFKLQYNKDQYGDRLVFFVGDGSAQRFVSGTFSLNTNQWYHLAGTWNAATDTLKVFVDGVEINSGTFAGSSYSDNTTRWLNLGSREYYNDYALDGRLDGIRISSTAIDFDPNPEPTTIKLFSIAGQN